MKPRRLRTLVPVAVVLLCAAGAWLLVATRPRVEVAEPETRVPRVLVRSVVPEILRLAVETHGTVRPRTESELVPEVSGPVVRVAPNFVSGGFFEEGDVLLEIDPRDYEAALERARAALVRAESEFARAEKELSRQRKLAKRGAASTAKLDDAVNAERVANAALREARAGLDKAERDLERTRVRAPYRGRVREESVGEGQFVDRGRPIATLYAIDYVEVRLPIPDRQLAYLDLPLAHEPGQGRGPGPAVRLHAEFAGAEHTWTGRIERTEGEIDPESRMVHAVARVENPYAPDEHGRPPLAVGLFVRAEIEGREFADVFVLPRAALHGGDRVWLADGEGRLRERRVEVLRRDRGRVVVNAGLARGDRVVVSPLEAPVDGSRVDPVRAPAEAPS